MKGNMSQKALLLQVFKLAREFLQFSLGGVELLDEFLILLLLFSEILLQLCILALVLLCFQICLVEAITEPRGVNNGIQRYITMVPPETYF